VTPILPTSRPQVPRELVEQLVRDNLLEPRLEQPLLVGVRGYFRRSMGAGDNALGLYDDAMFLLSPATFAAFNANVDPSRLRPRMATLALGLWRYKPGIHNQSKDPVEHPHYRALVQAAPVTVNRQPDEHHAAVWADTGYFGINIHKGGYTTTSSEGCQTIHPDQWDEFMPAVDAELARYGARDLAYFLTAHLPL
jgi:lysozyme